MKTTELLGLATTLRELSIPITGVSLPQDEWDELIKDIKTGHPAIYKKLNSTSIKMGGLHCELRRGDCESD